MYCIKKKKPAPRKSHRIEEQREGERSAGVVKRYGHHSDSATRRCCVLVLSNKTRRAPYPRPSMAPLTNLAAVRPCPTFLIKSWSYTRTTPGLPHASEYCGHCAKKKKGSSALSFYFFCPRTKRSGSREREDLPVSEHPEPKFPYVRLGEHVEQVRRIGKVYVVVAAPVREQVINLVERRHVRDGRVDVPARIQRR